MNRAEFIRFVTRYRHLKDKENEAHEIIKKYFGPYESWFFIYDSANLAYHTLRDAINVPSWSFISPRSTIEEWTRYFDAKFDKEEDVFINQASYVAQVSKLATILGVEEATTSSIDKLFPGWNGIHPITSEYNELTADILISATSDFSGWTEYFLFQYDGDLSEACVYDAKDSHRIDVNSWEKVYDLIMSEHKFET